MIGETELFTLPKILISPDMAVAIRDLCNQGESFTKVADRFGISPDRVRRCYRRYYPSRVKATDLTGTRRSKRSGSDHGLRRFSLKEDEIITELYLQNYSMKDIATEMMRPYSSIVSRLNIMGLRFISSR